MGGILILGMIALFFWLIGLIGEISNSNRINIHNQKKRAKYTNREINLKLGLFERNIDIIEKYSEKILSSSSYYCYIKDLTRDCLNEICLAENRFDIEPKSDYLKNWRDKNSRNIQWIELSQNIEDYFQNIQNKIKEHIRRKKEQKLRKEELIFKERAKILNEIKLKERDLNNKVSHRIDPKDYQEIKQKEQYNENFHIDDLKEILGYGMTWLERENSLISNKSTSKYIEKIAYKNNTEVDKINREIETYNEMLENDEIQHQENSKYFQEIKDGYRKKEKEYVLKRINFIIDTIFFPPSIPKKWNIDYDESKKILIVEMKLPNIVDLEILKTVELKTKTVEKKLTKKEFKDFASKIHPAIIIKIAYSIFESDDDNIIDLLAINGFVEHIDPSNGASVLSYVTSLATKKEEVLELNLEKIDSYIALKSLGGNINPIVEDVIPIVPRLNLDKKDKRFVETKEVLDKIQSQTNLASMDWQDFENLIAELFEKEFSEKGAEVKVTQSSRDRGVDAVIFDPDPIKGGKFVIQAKRYTKTVDVSAVRDLCAVVKKEGASRGILVTTSSYGPDAHHFANNEPISLLNGQELLGLLQKHGYTFKIDIKEARKILEAQ